MAKNIAAYLMGEGPQTVPAIERSRQMAQMLAGQTLTPDQQQIVSGVAVPYSPIQGLTKLAQAFMVRRMNEQADEKEQAMKTAQEQKITDAFGAYQSAMQGRPEMETEGPQRVGVEGPVTTAAVGPDKNQALAALMRGAQASPTLFAPFLANAMKTQEPMKVGPGDVVLGADNKPLYQAPFKPEEQKAPTSRQVQMGKEVVTQEFNPTTKTWIEVGRGEKGPLASVTVENINKGEAEQLKAMQKDMGDYRVQIQKAGVEAPRQLARLDRMEKLLEGVEGGKYSNNIAQLASVANSLGMKLDHRLGDKEAAESLAIEMASNFRQPGTGPMTDKDFENFMKRVPDLSKTSDGRREITKTMREFIKDDIETAKIAREYAKKNRGLLDEDFFAQVGEQRAKRGFGNFDQTLSVDEQNELAALRARFGK